MNNLLDFEFQLFGKDFIVKENKKFKKYPKYFIMDNKTKKYIGYLFSTKHCDTLKTYFKEKKEYIVIKYSKDLVKAFNFKSFA